jgi:hypothetical protein
MSEENKKYQVNIKKSSGKSVGDSKRDAGNNKPAPGKYKNFDKVYKSYADTVYSKPWFRFQFQKSKNRKVTLYIMVIVVVATLVVLEYLAE